MLTPVRRALLSVSDKTGIVEFARELRERGIELLSTGGTANLLVSHGITVKEVAEHTGFPEIMGGRLKTLHPKIHGGLLGRRGVDEAVMRTHGIEPIDLLAVTYPFTPRSRARGAATTTRSTISISADRPWCAAARITPRGGGSELPRAADELAQSGRHQCRHAPKLPPRRLRTPRSTTPWCPPLTGAIGGAPATFRMTSICVPPVPTAKIRISKPRSTRTRAISASVTRDGFRARNSYNNIVDSDTAWSACAIRCSGLRDRQARQSLRRGGAGTVAAAYARAYRTDPTSLLHIA